MSGPSTLSFRFARGVAVLSGSLGDDITVELMDRFLCVTGNPSHVDDVARRELESLGWESRVNVEETWRIEL